MGDTVGLSVSFLTGIDSVLTGGLVSGGLVSGGFNSPLSLENTLCFSNTVSVVILNS